MGASARWSAAATAIELGKLVATTTAHYLGPLELFDFENSVSLFSDRPLGISLVRRSPLLGLKSPARRILEPATLRLRSRACGAKEVSPTIARLPSCGDVE